MSVILMNDYFEEVSWLQSLLTSNFFKSSVAYTSIASGDDFFSFGNELDFNKYVLTEVVLI